MAVSGMRRIALTAIAAFGLVSAAHEATAQTPFTGVFTFGTNGNVNSFAYNGTPILNLTVGNLTKNNVTTGASSGNFRASNWALDASGTAGALTGSVDLSKYFEFTLTSASGFTFNLETLNFGVGRSSTGPRSFLWRSSADSYAASIPSYSSLGSSGFFSNTSGTLTMSDTALTTGTNVVLALSGSSLSYQSLSTISLRFYGYNSEASGGTGGFQAPLTFTGSLLGSAGTAYTWSGGAGNWENGQNGSFGQAYANSSTATATFNGTGDVVTVSGSVEAATMTIDSPGYSFQGGAISLANASVAVNADSTSIASVLAGSAGLLKTGTGSLVLTGSNTYVGLTNLSSGRLVIGSDSALGDASNDLAIAGTLVTTANVSLGSGRALSGAGTLDIAPGTTLTASGSFSMSSTTLANSGTLDLQGPTRAVGTLTFTTAATVSGSGPISLAGVTATAVTSGTATILPSIAYTSNGTKTVDVGSGGTLVLNGDVAGTTGRIAKSGAGTLVVNGSNSTSGYQVGVSGTTPTNGGTLILGSAAASGTGQLQLNFGTLLSTGSFTFANGLSVGGRANGLAVIGSGNAMTFSGTSNFFRSTNTSGELRLDVNNQTTLAGALAATAGSGSASGITIGGTGSLAINGNGSALVEPITLQDSLALLIGGTLGSAVTVGANNTIGGGGTILGSLAFSGSTSAFIFDAAKTLTVNGTTSFAQPFGLANLIGFSAAIPDGSYTLISGTLNTANLLNLGLANAIDLGAGRSAYFTEGSLVLQVVPEPSSMAIVGVGLAAAGYAAYRRRTAKS